MIASIRTLCATGLMAGAFVLATPHNAMAQGKGKGAKTEQKAEQKAGKAEQKAEKQVAKTTRKGTHRTVYTTRHRTTSYRYRVLCEDGTVVRRSTNACANHGGLAARQGTYGNYPPASDRARERANENSAVVRGIGANNVRTNAIARCNDGTYWHATTRDNACVDHGGVATWY
ncbi:MAG TPA: DUF3761 domain-containing protein [Gemmatimonadaceae bacterium]|nr:DUF3761 domain-containing protein [Gemmatimonadaceae bacterium]